MDVERDIALAQSLIDGTYKSNNIKDTSQKMFSSIYPFATENISGYFSQLNFKKKSVLTVCASGDHIINSILLGARSVDTFDVNPLTIYYYHLKRAAISALTYEEFFDFFCYIGYPTIFEYNSNAFNHQLYQKISSYLDGEVKTFWDTLFKNNEYNQIRTSYLFSDDESNHTIVKRINLYSQKQNYYYLRRIINKIPVYFRHSNIKDLSNDNNYDLILLSNISNYLKYMYEQEHLENYKKLITNLQKSLNVNGQICIAYLYKTGEIEGQYNEGLAHIYNTKLREQFFSPDEYTKLCFPSINHGINKKDSVLVYKYGKN